jgi:capsular polysaccharide biosynthesis protein
VVPRKLVEAAFRKSWLLLIPPIVVPILVVLLVHPAKAYASSVGAWVTSPSEAVDAGSLSRITDPLTTPAKRQQKVFDDLMRTESYREAVAIEAGLVTASATSAEKSFAAREIATHVTISATGDNLVRVTATSAVPERARSIAAAVVSQYQLRTTAEAQREAQATVTYFEGQLKTAQDDLAKAQSELSTYVQANPTAPQKGDADFAYSRLLARVDSQKKVVDRLFQSLQDAELKAASAPQSVKTLFNVIDEARLPESPEPPSVMVRAGYPAAGFMLGVLISAVYLYFTYRTDHTIRSSQDLQGIGVPILGFVPRIRPPAPPLWRRVLAAAWLPGRRQQRDYARHVAASLSAVLSERDARW